MTEKTGSKVGIPGAEAEELQSCSLWNKNHIHRNIDKMKRQRAMYQMKGQDKTPVKQLNEMEIGNLPEKELRIMIVKMIQNLGKSMEAKIEKMQEMFNKDLEELKNKQTKMNNTLTEMKNTLEGINSRITEAEEWKVTWKTEWWNSLLQNRIKKKE